MEYANAAKLLPPELLAQIKRYFPGGGLLFIPKEELDRSERAHLIVQLVEKDVPVNEVAEIAEVTPRHVRGLVKKHQDKQKRRMENI